MVGLSHLQNPNQHPKTATSAYLPSNRSYYDILIHWLKETVSRMMVLVWAVIAGTGMTVKKNPESHNIVIAIPGVRHDQCLQL